jgi:uncharacterized FlaG/YvyC family protein
MDISSISFAARLVTPEPAPPRPISEDQRALIRAVKAINSAELFGQENELTYVLDRGARAAVARIVNKETREVVKQIPAEYVLRMAEELERG